MPAKKIGEPQSIVIGAVKGELGLTHERNSAFQATDSLKAREVTTTLHDRDVFHSGPRIFQFYDTVPDTPGVARCLTMSCTRIKQLGSNTATQLTVMAHCTP